MKEKGKLLGAWALVAAMGMPISANAALQTLSSLFVFGDSLSDGGNSGLITGGAYPPPPYYNNQYSNGPVAVEYLWQSYNGNVPFAPSLAGGTNYAVGGATSGVLGLAPPPTPEFGNAWQLQQFKQTAPTFDPATSLFVIWLFPNDVFRADANGVLPGTAWGVPGGPLPEAGGLTNPANASALIANGVQNISYAVSELANAGAQHFLVPNMPDLGKTPDRLGTPDEAGLSVLSQTFNFYLAQAMSQLDATLTSAEIVQFDTFATFASVQQDPGAYGIRNTTQQCILNPSACAADNYQWLFWDGVHPTTYAHEILGAEFRAAVPEPESIFLVAIGLLGIVVTGRQRRKQRT
ncbi:MAG: Phosphatidylcholine-sterol acyltransferase precursor [Candidatus Accumulibacter sp. BA-94]|uniref:SGNH/GDSL hydrolase family protein n=1 Tax=Accumulibacter sp. TaxID=2053492 RepID=UPI00044B8569|nr:SGNH/GDSL hydrolase family protein [Accumulibacter sp.]EXI91732.1 MAG: Phosphatidylcholine-sterol acyltransferase precursor [Candidatus Accumulibacter sp. BA-94]MBL8392546.1 SGNH/GDSL hydrolase family protein [Accumulibacter sp.]HRD87698.1 SGNH/GDSL hydrolase family protein [Accumulibacter sp.]